MVVNVGTSDDWYLYLIRAGSGSLYTGVTTDVDRRFAEHQSGGGRSARNLRGKGPLKLVFRERVASSRSEAQKLEAKVKQLGKAAKEQMVESRTLPKGLR